MKRILTALSLVSLSFFFPLLAQAQSPNFIDPCKKPEGADTSWAPPDYCLGTSIGPVLGAVIQFLFVIAVILALGFLVYGGIKWITSGGDKGGVENARNMIIAAIVGLIVVFLAYVILNLVLQFLTGSSINAIEIPSLIK